MPSNKQKCVIYDAHKPAEYANYVFTHESEYEVVDLYVESEFIKPDKPNLFNIPISSASIGSNTLLFTCTLGHHSHISANITLSDCRLGDNVTIKNNTFKIFSVF